ncbi:metallophosphoesterase [Luteimonas sp. BDR2-5]|uniref:metallophosphoesterase n=1 Tax=Proluteimonas luteida TaxID=2878685 RepID=UPI001E45B5C5|nr:metallophosphoesterase [Luteimonas sp. BDR2-5]MCD9026698.1 metallophosphoesterase [Luteimonas sp. BDR2-5]
MCNHLGRTVVCALLFALSPALAWAEPDGPYLLPADADGWTAHWVEPDGEGIQVRREPATVGEEIAVPAIGALPKFSVRLRGPAEIAPDELALPSETPLLVIADTHGEYEILVELLRSQGVVDERLAWSFGTGHVVFLGDVFDRGAQQTEILWLLYQLEAEAARAGGGLHLLLGNHEALVLRGDERYLNPKYLRTAEALGVGAYADLFSADTPLGLWLRTRAAVLKLDGLLLLHGGVSPEVVRRGLAPAQLNRAVRDVLAGDADPVESDLHGFVMGADGQLWYRGYFPRGDASPGVTDADLAAALRHFGVDTILVGHTIVPEVTPLYGGKVIAVQVYPRRDEETGEALLGAVLREDGRWYRADVDGTRAPLQVEKASN